MGEGEREREWGGPNNSTWQRGKESVEEGNGRVVLQTWGALIPRRRQHPVNLNDGAVSLTSPTGPLVVLDLPGGLSPEGLALLRARSAAG